MSKVYKWGFINREGVMVIPPVYDGAWDFHESLAAVKVEWARGYINTSGEIVIEPQFQYAGPFTDGKALVQLDGLWGYIRPDGSWETEPHTVEGNPAAVTPEVPGSVPSADPIFCEGLAVMPKGRKYGFILEDGKWAFKTTFIQAKPFNEGLAAVLVAVD